MITTVAARVVGRLPFGAEVVPSRSTYQLLGVACRVSAVSNPAKWTTHPAGNSHGRMANVAARWPFTSAPLRSHAARDVKNMTNEVGDSRRFRLAAVIKVSRNKDNGSI